MLTDKKIVIFGGSSGIGLATARAAASAGAQLVIVSSNKARIDEALSSLPAGAAGQVVDLSKEEGIRDFFSSFGGFDHLVYTAGENISLLMLEDMELPKAKEYWNIRFWGAVAAVKYGAPKLNPGGSIGLVGGTASPRPGKGWSLGATICAAMEGFVRSMAVELAPVRVNLVAPGVLRTPLWNSLAADVREGLYASEAKRLPVGRVGEAEDIARTFIYFMEDGFVTGATLVVDGGAVLV